MSPQWDTYLSRSRLCFIYSSQRKLTEFRRKRRLESVSKRKTRFEKDGLYKAKLFTRN